MIQIGFCDDDPSVLDELHELLGSYRTEHNADIAPTAFQSPFELLASIEKGARFDILLLDVLMPGESGIEAAREIRQYDSNVKIIFLTVVYGGRVFLSAQADLAGELLPADGFGHCRLLAREQRQPDPALQNRHHTR